MIRARSVTKSYLRGGRRTPILRGVDLDVAAGSFAVLLGPSGCGKTTLLNLLGALDEADGGELEVAGVTLSPPSRPRTRELRRRRVSMIFQFYNLLPTLSARENVELALEPLLLDARERRERALEMLDRVGLAADAERFPGQLSGGEQQRVAIARALARRPQVVLADEPTGNLDRQSSRQIVALMRRLNEEDGTTFLIVTHDEEIGAGASHTLRMEDGRMLSGRPG